MTNSFTSGLFVVQGFQRIPQESGFSLTSPFSSSGNSDKAAPKVFLSRFSVLKSISIFLVLPAWLEFLEMAARIIAQLIVMGSGMMVRAVAQAYRQALANASKTGAAQEVAQNIRRAGKTMTETEARQILGIAEKSTWEEVLQKYDNLFEQNAKNGSFYLQSKVHRAKECLESVYQSKTQGEN